MALLVLALALSLVALPMGLAALPLLVVAMFMVMRDQPRGELLAVHEPSGKVTWRWRGHAERDWRDVSLRCDYLGPWLIGLHMDGRRRWLWPDSSDPDSLRQLRRIFVSQA